MAPHIAQLIRGQNQALGEQLVLGERKSALMDCTNAGNVGNMVMAKQIARVLPSMYFDNEQPLQLQAKPCKLPARLLSLLSNRNLSNLGRRN